MGWAANLPSPRWPTSSAGWAIAIGSSVVVGAALMVFLNTQTPGQSNWLPPCMFHAATGLFCPGCGITRALHALVHGYILKAWSMHPLALIWIGTIGVELADRALKQPSWWKKARHFLHDARVWAFVVIVFVVGRNLPWEPFASWAPG